MFKIILRMSIKGSVLRSNVPLLVMLKPLTQHKSYERVSFFNWCERMCMSKKSLFKKVLWVLCKSAKMHQ